MRKIAVEEHMENPAFRQFDTEAMQNVPFPATADAVRAKYLENLFDAPIAEHRIPTMDKYNIGIQLISPNAQAVQYEHNRDKAVEFAVKINDMTEEFISQAPDRLKGMAVLPMQDPNAAAEELERDVSKKKVLLVHLSMGRQDLASILIMMIRYMMLCGLK